MIKYCFKCHLSNLNYFIECFSLFAANSFSQFMCAQTVFTYSNTVCTHLAHTENGVALKRTVVLNQLIPKDKSNLFLSCKTFFFQKHGLLYFYCASLWQGQGNQC